jgi:lipopolysaccharide export system protein LptA
VLVLEDGKVIKGSDNIVAWARNNAAADGTSGDRVSRT